MGEVASIAFVVILLIVILVSIYTRRMSMSSAPPSAPMGAAPTASITVQPLFICGSTEIISVTWESSGARTTISTNPPVIVVSGALGVVTSRSATPIEVHLNPSSSPAPIRFTIESSRSGWPIALDHKDVNEVTRTKISGLAECLDLQGFGPSLAVFEDFLPSEWSEHFRVRRISVASDSTRPFEVRYNNDIIKSPETPSVDFLGTEFPLIGRWVLRSALAPGEVCNSVPPTSMDLDIEMVCS